MPQFGWTFRGSPDRNLADNPVDDYGHPALQASNNSAVTGLVRNGVLKIDSSQVAHYYLRIFSEVRPTEMWQVFRFPSVGSGGTADAKLGLHIWRTAYGSPPRISMHNQIYKAGKYQIDATHQPLQGLNPFQVGDSRIFAALDWDTWYKIHYTFSGNSATIDLTQVNAAGGHVANVLLGHVASDPRLSTPTANIDGATGWYPTFQLARNLVGDNRAEFAECRFIADEPSPPPNQPPTVDAGPDANRVVGNPIVRTAVGSDPDGDPVSYAWTAPAGVTLSGAATATVTATGTAVGVYAITCTVTAAGQTGSDTFILSVTSSEPVVYTKPTRVGQKVSGSLANVAQATLVVDMPDEMFSGGWLEMNVASAVGSGNPTVPTPAGWTFVNRTTDSNMALDTFQKTAVGNEPAVTLTYSDAAVRSCAIVTVYGGVQTADPYIARAAVAEPGTSVGPHSAPSVTNTNPLALGVYVGAAKGASPASWTAGTGITVRAQVDHGNPSASNCSMCMADTGTDLPTGDYVWSGTSSPVASIAVSRAAVLRPVGDVAAVPAFTGWGMSV